jgi:CheY-like chemotaxis protein
MLVVLDEPGFAERTAALLLDRGYEAMALVDPMVALEALEDAERIELLITSMDHGDGKPNGIALARMARLRKPHIKVLFVAAPGMERYTAGLGELLPWPICVSDVVQRAICLTEASDG